MVYLQKLLIGLCCATILLVGCTTIPLPERGALIVSAIPKSSDDTSWYRDYCTQGQPVNDDVVSYGDSCSSNQILHHAFLFKVKLSSVYSLEGDYFGNDIHAAMPGGQRVFWNQQNKVKEYFILQRVSGEIVNDTGVNFLMTPVVYKKELDCVGSFGIYPHVDYRNCPDKHFHKMNYDTCVPIEDVLVHFSKG